MDKVETFNEIAVTRRLAKDVGYCNACTDRSVVYVFEITLKSLSFILCFDCKIDLEKKLDTIRNSIRR